MSDVIYRAEGESRSFTNDSFVTGVQQALRARQDRNLVVDGQWGNTTSVALLAYARDNLSLGVVGAVTSFLGFNDSPLESLRIDTDRAITRLSDTVSIVQVRAAAAVLEKVVYGRDVNFADITVISANIPYNFAAPAPAPAPPAAPAERAPASTAPATNAPPPVEVQDISRTKTAPVSAPPQPAPQRREISNFESASAPDAPARPPAQTGMPPWGWLLIGSGVIAVAGGTAYYLTKKKEAERA